MEALRLRIEQLIEDLENKTVSRYINDIEQGRYDALNEVLEIILDYGEVSKEEQPQDVIMDTYNNLMKCPHCGEIIGNTADWTPNYCCECGKPLSGGNGKAQ